MKLNYLFLLFLLSISTLSIAQTNQNQEQVLRNIEQIMQGDNFVGILPENGRWSFDGKAIYFSKKSSLEPLPTWYKQGISNGNPIGSPLKIAENDFNLNPQNYVFGNSNSDIHNSIRD